MDELVDAALRKAVNRLAGLGSLHQEQANLSLLLLDLFNDA